MMHAALKVKGFALLDILQPCVSMNSLNTYSWYKERCKPLPADYDPADRQKALITALKWGDDIPVGVIYRGSRASFEELTPALHGAPLAEAYSRGMI